MGGTQLSGLIAGSQTQPAVLAFANGRTNTDPRVSMGYALVYPVAMIGKIFAAMPDRQPVVPHHLIGSTTTPRTKRQPSGCRFSLSGAVPTK